MAVVGAKLVANAVDEFLQSSTGDRTSLNDAIDSYRTAQSLSGEVMPDVQTFEPALIYRGSQTTGTTPYVAVVWEGSEEETAHQSHIVPHRIRIFFLLVNGDVDGDEATVAERLLDYDAVIRSMFLRNTTPGAYGGDLNNGGDEATGRILRAQILSSEILADVEINEANGVLVYSLRVDAIEDWPGA